MLGEQKEEIKTLEQNKRKYRDTSWGLKAETEFSRRKNTVYIHSWRLVINLTTCNLVINLTNLF